jgi:hypothetical protein
MKYIKRLIIFLIRVKLGVGKWDEFYFLNQKNKDDRYYFSNAGLMKYCATTNNVRKSSVSLNWLLSDSCEIAIDENFDWGEKIIAKCLGEGEDSE